MQGTRRVVALTGAEAVEAIRLADDLSEKLRSLDALSSSSLETETTAFKTVHPFVSRQKRVIPAAIALQPRRLFHRS